MDINEAKNYARPTMKSKFVVIEMTDSEIDWLRNFLANISLGVKSNHLCQYIEIVNI